jgi:hypothetical protein
MTALVVKMMDIDVESRDVGIAQLIKYQPNKRIQMVSRSHLHLQLPKRYFFLFSTWKYIIISQFLTIKMVVLVHVHLLENKRGREQ